MMPTLNIFFLKKKKLIVAIKHLDMITKKKKFNWQGKNYRQTKFTNTLKKEDVKIQVFNYCVQSTSYMKINVDVQI